eukprot:2111487-Rhodomonas_salina.1
MGSCGRSARVQAHRHAAGAGPRRVTLVAKSRGAWGRRVATLGGEESRRLVVKRRDAGKRGAGGEGWGSQSMWGSQGGVARRGRVYHVESTDVEKASRTIYKVDRTASKGKACSVYCRKCRNSYCCTNQSAYRCTHTSARDSSTAKSKGYHCTPGTN